MGQFEMVDFLAASALVGQKDRVVPSRPPRRHVWPTPSMPVDMTVCVAAVARDGNIFGAADRQITNGDDA